MIETDFRVPYRYCTSSGGGSIHLDRKTLAATEHTGVHRTAELEPRVLASFHDSRHLEGVLADIVCIALHSGATETVERSARIHDEVSSEERPEKELALVV